MKYYILLFMTFLMGGCQVQDDHGKSAAEKSLTSWANAYFNFDYEKALKVMTPESGQWLRFTASNITQEDVDFIKQHDAQTQVEILNSQITEGDSICNAYIRVSNFIQLGNTAQDDQMIDTDEFLIQLVKRDGDWLVKTEALPRSGKQSRD